MFRDISFGQYYPGDSIVHRLDPRIKLTLTLIFIVTIFFIQSYFGYAIMALFLMFVIIISKVPFRAVLKSIRTIIFLLVFASLLNLVMYKDGQVLASWWIFTITMQGIHVSAKIILRLVMLIMGTSLLTLTTTPMSLTDGIESLMRPLKVVKFPVHDVAIIMSIALRFIPTLTEETHKIINAQKARGASFDTGNIFKRAKAMIPILVPLFVSAFRRADDLAFALDARCYNATDKRTKMKVLKVKPADIVAFILTILVFAFIFVIRFYLSAELSYLLGGLFF